jgi:hypothetical protein
MICYDKRHQSCWGRHAIAVLFVLSGSLFYVFRISPHFRLHGFHFNDGTCDDNSGKPSLQRAASNRECDEHNARFIPNKIKNSSAPCSLQAGVIGGGECIEHCQEIIMEYYKNSWTFMMSSSVSYSKNKKFLDGGRTASSFCLCSKARHQSHHATNVSISGFYTRSVLGGGTVTKHALQNRPHGGPYLRRIT